MLFWLHKRRARRQAVADLDRLMALFESDPIYREVRRLAHMSAADAARRSTNA